MKYSLNLIKIAVFLSSFLIFLFISSPTFSDAEKLKKWDGAGDVNLKFSDLGGNILELKDFRESVILLNFWASWCAPCVNEMPALIKLSEKFKDFSFKLVMVNFGENTQKVRDFSKSLSNPSDIYLDQDKLSGNFWVTKGLPVTYLINKKGQITHMVMGEVDWNHESIEKIIRKLFKSFENE